MKVNSEFLDALSQERCTAIARHLMIDAPTGRWRGQASTIIIRVMRGWCPFPQEDPRWETWDGTRKLSVRLKEAYPFGERENHPYKAWLGELRVMRDIALILVGTLTQEMRDTLDVARDAEEQATPKALAAAEAMVRSIDYPILFLKCGVCGKVGMKKPCVNLDTMKKMIVPHEGRLPLATRPQVPDVDLPLFAGGV